MNEHDLKPHNVRYYLEKRDPAFDRKIREVLFVYKKVTLEGLRSGPRPVYTVSVDKTPGVQSLGLTVQDRSPVSGKHSMIPRDHEYVRLGTSSILAALDLHDAHVIA